LELYEAGKIDGTSWFSEFWHITLPSIRATIGVVILLGIIWNIQQMVIVWLLTKGGPAHATETIVVYVYRNAFEFFDMGYASTVGIVMMIVSLALAIVYLRVVQKRD
jgi:ABC-type sugar transport system permease subunit